MEKTPCYGCDKRQINCHSKCPEYCTWRKAKDEEKRKHKLFIEVKDVCG